MMKGWKEYRLDNFSTVIMGLSPKGDTYNYDGIGVPLLNGPTEFGETYPNCTQFTTDPKRICKKGDLIFCVRGSTTGRMNWADKPYALGRGVCSITGLDELTTKFIKQLLTINLSGLLQITGGGTFPNLRKEDINGFKFKAPINYRKIACILSAYDDLIENNLERIKLLEEKAQLTYEEWFVKMRFPGHETAVYDEESGLPEGWEKKTLRDLSKRITKGTTPTSLKKQFTETGINFIKAESYADDGFFKREKFAFIDEETNQILKRSQLKENDIIVSIAGVLGRVALISKEVLPANTNQAVGIISLDQSLISPYHIKYFLSSEYMNKLINVISGQAAQPNINLAQLGSFNVSVPSKEITFRFQNLIEPIFKTQQCLVSQNRLLKEARDILLPRLMSGMIDVEEIVGSSVLGMVIQAQKN